MLDMYNYKNKALIIVLINLLFLVGHIIALEDDSSSGISITGGVFCNHATVEWEDYRTLPFLKTNSSGDCYKAEGTLEKECCASGYNCTGSMGFPRICKFMAKYYCWELNSGQEECEGVDFHPWFASASAFKINNAICGLSGNFFSNGETCINNITCLCKWNNGKCDVNVKTETKCESLDLPPVKYGECTWTLNSVANEDCSNGDLVVFHFTSEKTADYPYDDCPPNKELTVPCESVPKLGFFSIFNLIEVIFILILVYSFYIIQDKFKKE